MEEGAGQNILLVNNYILDDLLHKFSYEKGDWGGWTSSSVPTCLQFP